MLRLYCRKCKQLVCAKDCAESHGDAAGICPVCGTELPPHRYLESGTNICGFRIGHEIGRGGMGVVYQAKQLNLNRDVALKILSDEMAGDEQVVQSFFREARAAAALDHPNIVSAYDIGTDTEKQLHFFVMELIDGVNLEKYIEEHGALELAPAVKCAVQIADALAYAWSAKKLAHRDIKPENIILTQSGDFKLADLGLARSYGNGMNGENAEMNMATPAYASPEVIRMENDKIGFKSDMYSFGATLYQIFTGEPPFSGKTPEEVCEKQLNEQPKPLIGVRRGVPERLSVLVDKLMEKAPEKRPASWNDVLHTMNRIKAELNSEWQQTAPEPEPEKKRNFSGMITAAAAVLVLSVGAAIFLLTPQETLPADTETFVIIPMEEPEPTVPEPVNTVSEPENAEPSAMPDADTAKEPEPPELKEEAEVPAAEPETITITETVPVEVVPAEPPEAAAVEPGSDPAPAEPAPPTEQEKLAALEKFYAAVRKNDAETVRVQKEFLLQECNAAPEEKAVIENICTVFDCGSLTLKEIFTALCLADTAAFTPFPVSLKDCTYKGITAEDLVLLRKDPGSGLRFRKKIPWEALESGKKILLNELIRKSDLYQYSPDPEGCRKMFFCAAANGVKESVLINAAERNIKNKAVRNAMIRVISNYCTAIR